MYVCVYFLSVNVNVKFDFSVHVFVCPWMSVDVVDVWVCLCKSVYFCVCLCMSLYVCVCLCMSVCVCVCMYGAGVSGTQKES